MPTRSRRWSQFRKARQASFSASSKRASCAPASILRIPPGNSHRWVAEPSGLRAIAAYGAAQLVTRSA